MANPWGWSEAIEAAWLDQTLDWIGTQEAFLAMVPIENDPALTFWAQTRWCHEQLESWDEPEVYDTVLNVLSGRIDTQLEAWARGLVTSNATVGNRELKQQLDTAVIEVSRSALDEAHAAMSPTIKAWMDEAREARRQTQVDAQAAEMAQYVPPESIDACWDDPQWGDAFREWARAQPIAAEIDFCLAVEQTYIPDPSTSNALMLLTTYLLEGADQPVLVSDGTMQALMASMPDQDADPDEPLAADLFGAAHGEASVTLGPWYDSYRYQLLEAAPKPGQGQAPPEGGAPGQQQADVYFN